MIYFTAYYSKVKPIGVSQPRVSLRFRKSPGTSHGVVERRLPLKSNFKSSPSVHDRRG
jgi:hypothetical protein